MRKNLNEKYYGMFREIMVKPLNEILCATYKQI